MLNEPEVTMGTATTKTDHLPRSLELDIAVCDGDESMRVLIDRDELCGTGPANARVQVTRRDGSLAEMVLPIGGSRA